MALATKKKSRQRVEQSQTVPFGGLASSLANHSPAGDRRMQHVIGQAEGGVEGRKDLMQGAIAQTDRWDQPSRQERESRRARVQTQARRRSSEVWTCPLRRTGGQRRGTGWSGPGAMGSERSEDRKRSTQAASDCSHGTPSQTRRQLGRRFSPASRETGVPLKIWVSNGERDSEITRKDEYGYGRVVPMSRVIAGAYPNSVPRGSRSIDR